MNETLEEGRVVEETALVAEAGMVAMLNRSEIDQQIATAKKYPRSVALFIKRATELVSLNESIAQQCIYALPRDNKVIEGPSARMAEVIFNAWGNARAGARVVSDTGDFVTAQGVFQDLEQNTAITYEVQRRITNKRGQRYNADMIGVTGNAACSIALRNAILKGIPKAYWEGIYKKARSVVAGDIKTLANKRADAIQAFVIYGITEAQILAKLGKAGIADINTDDLVLLFGMLTAIKDGDTTPEQAFATTEETRIEQPKSKSEQKPETETPATATATDTSSGAAPAEPQAKAEDAKPMSPSQCTVIRAKLKRAALSELDLETAFPGKALEPKAGREVFPASESNAVQEWIAKNAKG
jgi:hypothetical protein